MSPLLVSAMLTFSSLSANPAAYQQAPQMDRATQIRMCQYYIYKLQMQNNALNQQIVLLKRQERDLSSQLDRGYFSISASGFRMNAIAQQRVALIKINQNRMFIRQLYNKLHQLGAN